MITLKTNPALEQAGGVYSGTTETEFILEATDGLSGVTSIEVSLDGRAFTAYEGPFRLKQGSHTLQCRAADRAGNWSDLMTGSVLTGGESARLQLNIQ